MASDRHVSGRWQRLYGVILTVESRPTIEVDNEVAFERLLSAHYADAFRLAIAMLHNRAEAEDAIQGAAIRAWRALCRSQKITAERPWFMAIVANECRNARRRRWWSVLRVAAPPISVSQSAPEEALDVRRALAQLPHNQRLVVVLRYYLDLPYNEIAVVIGTSEEAARARAHRALQKLERQLHTLGVMP